MKFKIGDRVRILPSSKYWKTGDSNNPQNITGTVDKIVSGICVMWDNNRHNTYSSKDLEIVSEEALYEIY